MLFSDAFDVLFTKDLKQILKEFEASRKRLLFAGECGCWPQVPTPRVRLPLGLLTRRTRRRRLGLLPRNHTSLPMHEKCVCVWVCCACVARFGGLRWCRTKPEGFLKGQGTSATRSTPKPRHPTGTKKKETPCKEGQASTPSPLPSPPSIQLISPRLRKTRTFQKTKTPCLHLAFWAACVCGSMK